MKSVHVRFAAMLFFVFASMLFLSFGSSVAQTTVELQSDRDNTLYENPTGSSSNGAGQHLFAGRTSLTGGGLIRRALLHFDIAATIPSGAIIQSATLTLNMSRSISGNELHMLHPVQADWGEGTSNAPGQEGSGTASTNGDATWKHTFFPLSFWSTDGGDVNMSLTTNQTIGGLGFYTWGPSTQMITDIQGWLDNPATNFGWLLMGNEATMTTAKRFDSREHPLPANRPKLTITYNIPVVSCCFGSEVGDANLSGDISVADIAEIVNMKFGTGIPAGPWCLDEADANYSRSVPEATIGDVSVGDIAAIVDRKFGTGDLLVGCDGL